MTLETKSLALLQEAVRAIEHGYSTLPRFEGELPEDELARMREVLLDVAMRLGEDLPYPHPMYAGQMLKPPHPVARAAYQLAQWVNPNNHALDGGRASSAMEKAAVAEIAAMFGWTAHLGHLTGGGTMANLEALWVAGRLAPGKTILASSIAHYTHKRITEVLRIPFEEVPVDDAGRMDAEALARRVRRGDVGAVVATMGTTMLGSVDPLPAILGIAREHDLRVHADAAYGGYFTLAEGLAPGTRAAFDALEAVDSLAIDPHKHGLQPYGCGCVLFRDPAVGAFYRHDSPNTYFSSKELHLGEISLECSRPGAAAVALWATQQLLPLRKGGRFAEDLARCRRAALALYARLATDRRFRVALEPELDIVAFAPRAASASATSKRTQEIFVSAAASGLHLAVARLPRAILGSSWPDLDWDQDEAACLRSCLMKPAHLDWVDRIVETLGRAASEPGARLS